MVTIKGHDWEWDLTLDVTEVADMTGWADGEAMQKAFDRATRDREFCHRLVAAGTGVEIEAVKERMRKWSPRDLHALLDDFINRTPPPDPQQAVASR